MKQSYPVFFINFYFLKQVLKFCFKYKLPQKINKFWSKFKKAVNIASNCVGNIKKRKPNKIIENIVILIKWRYKYII